MRKRTTTKQLNTAITNNLLQIAKVEVYYKTSGKTETIGADKFKESFDFLCESGCFANCVGWHYERNYKTGDYEIDCGRMNSESEIIVTAYLRVCDNTTDEEMEKTLLFEEE